MATFGNLKQAQTPVQNFTEPPQRHQLLPPERQAVPGYIPTNRPVPWLGAHIFDLLLIAFLVLLSTILILKFSTSF